MRVARLEDREGLARAVGPQMAGRADAGQAGADDQHVEVLGGPLGSAPVGRG